MLSGMRRKMTLALFMYLLHVLTSSETLTVLPWDSPLLDKSKQFPSKKQSKQWKRKGNVSFSISRWPSRDIGLSRFITDLFGLGNKLLPYCSNRAMMLFRILAFKFSNNLTWSEMKKNARARKVYSVFHKKSKNLVVVTSVTLSLLLNEAFSMSQSSCW